MHDERRLSDESFRVDDLLFLSCTLSWPPLLGTCKQAVTDEIHNTHTNFNDFMLHVLTLSPKLAWGGGRKDIWRAPCPPTSPGL